MKTPLLEGEKLKRDGAANLQRGIETVGGWLYLTNLRLIFESHAFNIRTGATIIPLEKITRACTCWTKFLNLIPLFPNSMAVSTDFAKDFRFVVFGRHDWVAAIEKQRLSHAGSEPKAATVRKDQAKDDRVVGSGPHEASDAIERPGVSRPRKDPQPPT
jgi:hypothetical protein